MRQRVAAPHLPSASYYPLHVVPLTNSSEQRERVHDFRSGSSYWDPTPLRWPPEAFFLNIRKRISCFRKGTCPFHRTSQAVGDVVY
ncbi:MAG: hypothetical protein LBQ54_10280 [Planctomycetaceae bacterium]|nr:hypothetical protein [Planctomycetaceae bacterium]